MIIDFRKSNYTIFILTDGTYSHFKNLPTPSQRLNTTARHRMTNLNHATYVY